MEKQDSPMTISEGLWQGHTTALFTRYANCNSRSLGKNRTFLLHVLPTICNFRTTWITAHTFFKHPWMDSTSHTHTHTVLSNCTPHHFQHTWASFHVCNPAKAKKTEFQDFKKRRKPYVLPGSAPALSTADCSHRKMHSSKKTVSSPPKQVFFGRL